MVFKMKLSKHATSRCNQRGIKQKDIKYIIALGKEIERNDGIAEFVITKQDVKIILQKIDKLIGKKIIIGNDDTIITAYQIEK